MLLVELNVSRIIKPNRTEAAKAHVKDQVLVRKPLGTLCEVDGVNVIGGECIPKRPKNGLGLKKISTSGGDP
jgi:hypothetical protein